MQTQPSLAELVVRDITEDSLDVAEKDILRDWTNESPAHARLLARLRDAQWRMQEWQTYKNVDKQAVWTRIQDRVAQMPGEAPLPPLEHPDWEG